MKQINEFKKIKPDEITLEQVLTELECRDRTNTDLRWDEDLSKYTIEELEQIKEFLLLA